jgi:ribosomal protein S18 acetylase RimI-like enzyme
VNQKNYVAKHGARVIGFVRLERCLEAQSPWEGTWLSALEVWTQYRGFGVGEMLVRRVVAQAVTDGAPEIFLAVFEDNSRAIALYRKLGFEQVTLPALEPQLTTEKHRFGRRRIVMRKGLASHR